MKIPDLIELKNQLLEITDIINAASCKKEEPLSDEMSTRQAYAQYGKGWINYHVSRKHIRAKRKGPHPNSKKVFSRLELMALKESEKRIADYVKERL